MKSIVFIVLASLFLASCENEMILPEKDKVNVSNVEVTNQLQGLPDPSLEEVKTAISNEVVSNNSSSLKLKSALVNPQLVEVQRLDSGYFISDFTRRYFIKVSDENESEVKVGYMYQKFESLDQNGQLGNFRITFAWGLSEMDSISKKVRVVTNMATEGYDVLFTSTTGISLSRVLHQGDEVLLPPLNFDVSSDVKSATFGSLGCATVLQAAQTQLVLDVEIQPNVVAIVQFNIPSDMQAYAGRYWFDIRGSGDLHIHRSYSVAAGEKVVKISLPFTPVSMSMEQKLLKQGRWNEEGLYYGTTFTFLSKENGVTSYEGVLTHL